VRSISFIQNPTIGKCLNIVRQQLDMAWPCAKRNKELLRFEGR
jgi:hypothetical protein